MKKEIVLFAFAALMFCFGGNAAAQTPDLTLGEGVKGHKGVDKIYNNFSRGYRTLDHNLVANQYTQDAAYLSPGRDSGIRFGRNKILASFSGFFENMKRAGRNMEIKFMISQRKVGKNMGYDVGVFDLKYYKDGKMLNHSMGKFVVVTVKGKDKKWRFQVDGYNDLNPQTN